MISRTKILLVLALAGSAAIFMGSIAHKATMFSENADGELAQKNEWSVLQVVEYENRDKENAGGPRLIANAAGSTFVVLGLPLVNQNKGYAWLLLNPSSKPTIKLLPSDAQFSLSKKDFELLKAKTQLEHDLSNFLEQRIKN